jgi:nifR3 family TIM-barrel protein
MDDAKTGNMHAEQPTVRAAFAIGGFVPESPFFLCPLAGFTDLSFRRMIRPLGGLGLAYTELVNPRGLQMGSARSLQIVETSDDDRPLAVQLYGTEPHELADAAVWAAERGAPVVDINMGCPAPKIAGKGGGSGILRHCPDAVSLAATVVKACPIPVTVKTRLGWFQGDLVAPELARQFEDVGVAAVTIHGRFGEQRFSGAADWSAIARVVEAVRRIPVIGNGDVRSPADALRLMSETGCAGVMIGRRALADPWIFRDACALWSGGSQPPAPTREERLERMLAHFGMMTERLGERRGVVEFRKRVSWWAKGLAPCPTLRRLGPTASTRAEFLAIVERTRAEFDARFGDDEPCLLHAANEGED